MRFTLRKKISLIFSLLMIFTLSLYTITISKSRLEALEKKQIKTSLSLFSLISGAYSRLSVNNENFSNSKSLKILQSLSDLVYQWPDIRFMTILNREGLVLADTMMLLPLNQKRNKIINKKNKLSKNQATKKRRYLKQLLLNNSTAKKALSTNKILSFIKKANSDRRPSYFISSSCKRIRPLLPTDRCVVIRTPLYSHGVYSGIIFGAISLSPLQESKNDLIQKMGLFFIGILFLIFILVNIFSRSLTGPLMELVSGVKKFQQKKSLEKVLVVKSKDEVGELTSVFNSMAKELGAAYKKLENKIELVNAELLSAHKDLQEKQKLLQSDIQYAAQIQSSFLPENINLKTVQVYSVFKPMMTVSGDFFAYRHYSEYDGRLGIGIGDVSGHGIPASFGMIRLRDGFFATPGGLDDPARVLNSMNQIAVNDFSEGLYATFLFLVINEKHKSIRVASGGNPPVILMRKGKAKILASEGMLLGVMDDYAYESESFNYQAGDLLFLCTDGVTEIKNKENVELQISGTVKILEELFSKNTLQSNLAATQEESLAKLSEKILEKLFVFQDNEELTDDLTFILCQL